MLVTQICRAVQGFRIPRLPARVKQRFRLALVDGSGALLCSGGVGGGVNERVGISRVKARVRSKVDLRLEFDACNGRSNTIVNGWLPDR